MTSHPPEYVRALKDIAGSNLPPIQRDVLRAMLHYGLPGQVVWPAVETLARDMGRAVATVRRAVRGLELLGVMVPVLRSVGGRKGNGRGISNRWWLDFGPLASVMGPSSPAAANGQPSGVEQTREVMNPNVVSGLPIPAKPESRQTNPITVSGLDPCNPIGNAAEPDRARHATRSPRPTNPLTVIGEPSIQPIKEQINEIHASGDSAACMVGCGNGMSLRGVLAAAGVRGRNLSVLCASPLLSPEIVRREYESVVSDRSVRNAPAVLVSRLAEQFGIALNRRANLSPSERRLADDLDKIRRRSMRTRGPESLGDIAKTITPDTA